MKKLPINTLFLLSLLIAFGSSCKRRSVTRINPNEQTDLSGRWNDTDSKLVAEEMVEDVLTHPWREEFVRKNNTRPVVIVGMIQNKTHEHIQPEVFIKDIQKEFINSGMIRVVQNSELREMIRQERGDQQEFASKETQKQFGKELGADYMMFGTINSIVDQYKNKKAVFYQVNLELANIETNEIVWIGEKEIKKFIEN